MCKPQKKSIELLCKKYNINAAWLYTGEGDMFLAGIKPFEQHVCARRSMFSQFGRQNSVS